MNQIKRTSKRSSAIIMALTLLLTMIFSENVLTASAALEDCNKLTVPNGAAVSVVNISGYYGYSAPLVPVETVENGDGTTSYYYNCSSNAETVLWRASMPGKVTQAGWGVTKAGIAVDFDGAGKDKPGDAVSTAGGVADRDSNSMLMNVNASQFLQLRNVGDTYALQALRTWEIIDSETMNREIPPDYHYNFLVNDGVVSLTPNANVWFNNRSTVTALKEGTAILEVSYDAIDVIKYNNSASYPAGRYGANLPERKGLAVITVGDIAQGDVLVQRPWEGTGSFWDAELDTWYFTGDSEQIQIQPTAANASSVQSWNPDAQADWVDVTDGKLTLYGGSNIVKVTVDGGLSYYKVIRANAVTVQAVSEVGNRALAAGDQVRVLWGGSSPAYPIPKISGIYNPGSYALYSAWDDVITVTQDMVDKDSLYANATNIWPNSVNTNTGDSGCREIRTTVNAFGAAFGGHRAHSCMGAANTSPNSGANTAGDSTNLFYNVIPPISLSNYAAGFVEPPEPPAEPDAPADITVSVQLDDSGFYAAKQAFTVESDLSESFGFDDEYNGLKVTAMDALVAAHIAMFGEEDLDDYIDTSSGMVYGFGGYIPLCFVNGAQQGNGNYVSMPGYGTQQTGCSIPQTLIADGDDVFFADSGEDWDAFLAWFEQGGAKTNALTATVGEDISLTLKGLMNWYCLNTPEEQADHTWDVYDAEVQLVEIEETPGLRSAYFEDSGITTDDDGEFTINFDEPGTYIISAIAGDFDFPLISPWLVITVTKSAAQLRDEAKTAKIAEINAVVAGLEEKDYTPESWAVLKAAIDEAIAAVNAAATVEAVGEVVLPSADILNSAAELTCLQKILAFLCAAFERIFDFFKNLF